MISEASFARRLKIFYIRRGTEDGKQYPSARIDDSDQSEAYKWCDEHFGENWIWSSLLHTDYTDIYFLNTGDVLLFKLRFETL